MSKIPLEQITVPKVICMEILRGQQQETALLFEMLCFCFTSLADSRSTTLSLMLALNKISTFSMYMHVCYSH